MNKESILQASLKLFEEEGVKFSILDIAKLLQTSKRTIYQHFESKDELIMAAIDYVFEDIERQHHKIIMLNISECQKLKSVLAVYPSVINLNNVQLKKVIELYPNIYKHINYHLSIKWDLTLNLLASCQQNGFIKEISEHAFKAIFLGMYDKVMNYENHQSLLNECIEIVFEGLKK